MSGRRGTDVDSVPCVGPRPHVFRETLAATTRVKSPPEPLRSDTTNNLPSVKLQRSSAQLSSAPRAPAGRRVSATMERLMAKFGGVPEPETARLAWSEREREGRHEIVQHELRPDVVPSCEPGATEAEATEDVRSDRGFATREAEDVRSSNDSAARHSERNGHRTRDGETEIHRRMPQVEIRVRTTERPSIEGYVSQEEVSLAEVRFSREEIPPVEARVVSRKEVYVESVASREESSYVESGVDEEEFPSASSRTGLPPQDESCGSHLTTLELEVVTRPARGQGQLEVVTRPVRGQDQVEGSPVRRRTRSRLDAPRRPCRSRTSRAHRASQAVPVRGGV